MGCEQIVEGFDLRVEDCDILRTLDPDLAFGYRLAGLYRLGKLVTVGATVPVGILRARSTLTRARPTNAGGLKVE
jgi:hypothetical protein